MIADIVPIVMAGIIGIYGLVVSVLIANTLNQKLALYTGFIQLGAGLAVGLAGLAAGYVRQLLQHVAQGNVPLYSCPRGLIIWFFCFLVLPSVSSVTLVSEDQPSNPDSTSV